MIPSRIQLGDTIGICAISHVALREKYKGVINNIKKKGFRVKEADHFYADTYGYLASPEERATDFNQLVNDSDVKMIFFGGGEGSNEVLPLLNYEGIKRNPKIICAFSDATSILNAVWSKTGLEVYYGQEPYMFEETSDYNESQFELWLMKGNVKEHIPNTPWLVQHEGTGEGILIGGYSRNFAMLQNTEYFTYDKSKDYLLFIEDHEMFGDVAYVSSMLTHIEQSGIMENIRGVLFGNYSDEQNDFLLGRLQRLGEKYQIPVIYCDDFGHGSNHAIIPLGRRAILDTKECKLKYI